MYGFMIKGLEETEQNLRGKNIPFHLLEGFPQATVPDFVSAPTTSPHFFLFFFGGGSPLPLNTPVTVATLKPLPLLLMLTRTTSFVLLTFCCCLHKRKVAAQGAAAVVTDMSPLKTPMGWAQGTSTPLKVTLHLLTLPPTLPKRIHPGHNSVRMLSRPLFSLVPILTPHHTHILLLCQRCCFKAG